MCINVGVAGDTASLMRRRVDRDVLAHRPTLVTISAGVNDVLRTVPPASFDADVYAAMDAARAGGAKLLGPDEVHLGFEGYRVFAGAVLAGPGHRLVPVPKAMKIAPLDAAAVAKLQPDGRWKTLALPETDAQTHWWHDQIRRRGHAMSVARLAGKAKRYVGQAERYALKACHTYTVTNAKALPTEIG